MPPAGCQPVARRSAFLDPLDLLRVRAASDGEIDEDAQRVDERRVDTRGAVFPVAR